MKKAMLFAVISLLVAGSTFGQSATANLSITVNPGMGPLTQSTVNNRYFVTPSGQVVYLTGSHTWDDFDDTSTAATPPAFDFNAFVSLLQANGHNATILWHKDMPRECNWQNSATYNLSNGTQFGPWLRTGLGNASDGLPKFDLTQFNQAYFDRLAARVQTLQNNNIYAIIELFDGNNLTSTRCGTNTSPNGDGFPLTGANNINGVTDNYSSGTAGVGAYTEASAATNPNLVAVLDAYVRKVIDTLNPYVNVVWEVGEEQPGTSFSGTSGYGGASSMTWFMPHMKELITVYEGGGTCTTCTGSPSYAAKPFKHLVGIGSMNSNDFNDATLYGSTMDWIGPQISNNFANQFPCITATNNQGKLVINDTDHTCGASTLVVAATGVVNDAQIRHSIWGTFVMGGSGYVFMDPYHMSLPVNNRNPCASPTSGVCTTYMTKYDPMRQAMGYVLNLLPTLVNLQAMTPQASLCSTGLCMVNNSATAYESVIYSDAAASLTANLSGQPNRLINAAWEDPTTGIITSGTQVTGGSATQSFSAPWGNARDAVLHLTDGGPSGGGGAACAGNQQIPCTVGWFQIPNTNLRPLCPSYSDIQGTTGCAAEFNAWAGAQFDSLRDRFMIVNAGHVDYHGNEVYSVNMSQNPITVTLLRDASHGANWANACVEANPDGTMAMKHMYNGEQYLYWFDLYGFFGGSKDVCGFMSNIFWYNDPLVMAAGNQPWVQPTVTGSLPEIVNGSVPEEAYYRGDDTHTPKVYDLATDSMGFYSYDPYTSAWTFISNVSGSCAAGNVNVATTIDPVRRLYFIIGSGAFCKIPLDGPYVSTSLTGTNCGTIKNPQAPGIEYDPVFRDIALWSGGNTVFFYNPDTDSCTSTSPSGGPGAAPAVGVYGHWRWDPINGVFVAGTSVDANFFTFRRAVTSDLQAQDWTNQSTAAGVIATAAWDNLSDFNTTTGNGTGLKVSASNGTKMTQDTTHYTQGGSSLHCKALAQSSGPDVCGAYWLVLPTTITQNQDVWFGYYQNISQEVLNQSSALAAAGANTFFKMHIFASNGPAGTCAQLEWTFVNLNNRKIPSGYTNCGQGAGSQISCANANCPLYEEGEHSVALGGTRDTGFNCYYGNGVGNGNGPRSCATFPAGVWVWNYFHLHLGTWDANGTGQPNSTIEAWRALPGQPLMKYSQTFNYVINRDTCATQSLCTGFNLIDFLHYYTNRCGSCVYATDGVVLYDSAIVSTQPIIQPARPVM